MTENFDVRPFSELGGKWIPLDIEIPETHINTPEENLRNFEFMERNQERLIATATTVEDFRTRINAASVLLRGSKTGKSGDGSQMSEDNINYFYMLGKEALDLISMHARGKGILERSDWNRIKAFKRNYKVQPKINLG